MKPAERAPIKKMSFNNDLINDLDVFFNEDEHAVDITYNSTTIQGVFDNEFIAAADDSIGVETTSPRVQVKTSDVLTAVHDDIMTINSIAYKISGIQPDGTGTTLILLSQD